jgi:cytidylate kinase
VEKTRVISVKPVVAIDGPAGSGKSSVAREVARWLGFKYVDTGAMYRSVAAKALQEGIDPNDKHKVTELAQRIKIEFRDSPRGQRVIVDSEDFTDTIRTRQATWASSIVSTFPGVRRRMVARQREMAASGGVVVEGRDVQTVVFPEADVKVYLDASPEVRARRRLKDEEKTDRSISMEDSLQGLQEVLAELVERDEHDSTRTNSPLKPAPDAAIIDTSDMTLEQVVEKVLSLIPKPTPDA